jgi:hypothetical protein
MSYTYFCQLQKFQTGHDSSKIGDYLTSHYIAFCGYTCIARAEIWGVVSAVKQASDGDSKDRLVVYDDQSSEVIELDLRGSADDVLARLASHPILAQRPEMETPPPELTPDGQRDGKKQSGPGRPKLGVVSREVSLLPRHWDWLSRQSGGASAALRRLVDEARKSNLEKDRLSEAQQAVHRFLWDMAGNLPSFEEVTRAFYAGDFEKVRLLIQDWPPDVRVHTKRLVQRLLPDGVRAIASS